MAQTLAGVPLEGAGVRTAYARQTARTIAGGQWQAARLAAAYVRAYAEPVEPVDLGRALADELIGPEDPQALVGLLRLWTLLDDGMDEDQARAEAGDYAGGLAELQVQQASKTGMDEAADATGRSKRYRLEPNPNACEWCREVAENGIDGAGPTYSSAARVPTPHSPGGKRPGGKCNCEPAVEFEEE